MAANAQAWGRCHCCGKPLGPSFVWLELDSLTNQYHVPGQLPAGAVSQGLFRFGRRCAARVRQEQRSRERTL